MYLVSGCVDGGHVVEVAEPRISDLRDDKCRGVPCQQSCDAAQGTCICHDGYRLVGTRCEGELFPSLHSQSVSQSIDKTFVARTVIKGSVETWVAGCQGGSVAEWLACWTRAQKARVQIAVVTLSSNSLRQTVHTHRASVHQTAKLVAALLRVARVTAGLAESNGSLPPGL